MALLCFSGPESHDCTLSLCQSTNCPTWSPGGVGIPKEVWTHMPIPRGAATVQAQQGTQRHSGFCPPRGSSSSSSTWPRDNPMGSAGHTGDTEREGSATELQAVPSGSRDRPAAGVRPGPRQQWGRAYSQHHQAAEVLEGVVGDVADAVEGQGHGLQGREVVEGPDRDLGEGIVI